MQFYPTPNNIVSIIQRHIPKHFKNFLEPSVGEGALLSVLNTNTKKSILTLIDIDDRKILGLKPKFEESELINDNFITWSNQNSYRKFDLIVTNPPFLAKSSELINFRGKNVPVELAFMELCLEHLTDGGVIIGIVPCSVINSNNGKGLRKKFFAEGNFKYVYELPKKTFQGIEGSFFIVVYLKGCDLEKKTIIRDLVNNYEDIAINSADLVNLRLDYSFISSLQFYNSLESTMGQSGNRVLKLSEISLISRGRINNDYKNTNYIHTSSLKDYLNTLNINPNSDLSDLSICLKRVSRKANYSFSLIKNKDIYKCTDCLFIIKLQNIDVIKVIFSLRVLYSNSYGEALIMKGSGAKFISVKELRDLDFIDLSNIFYDAFMKYKLCTINQDYDSCLNIERRVFNKIKERIGYAQKG